MHASRLPLFLSLITACFLSGCASTDDPEDRAFFTRGWINPRELDTDDTFRPLDRTAEDLPPRTGIRGPL